MHDRRNDRSDRGRSRHGDDRDHGRHRHRDERCDHEHGPHRHGGDDRDRGGRSGGGPDTRFLQLEMSEVLYSEAESVTRQAFRELLLEEAKARFRERFGDQIAGLAQLAVDELMQEVLASLDIEERIREQNLEQQGRSEKLSGILRAGRGSSTADDEGGGPEPED